MSERTYVVHHTGSRRFRDDNETVELYFYRATDTDHDGYEITVRPIKSKRERKIDAAAELIPGAWAATAQYDPGYKRIAGSIVDALEAIDKEEP